MGFSEAFNKVSQDVLFYTLCIRGLGNKLLRQAKNWDLILEASNYDSKTFSYVRSCGKVNRKMQVRKASRNEGEQGYHLISMNNNEGRRQVGFFGFFGFGFLGFFSFFCEKSMSLQDWLYINIFFIIYTILFHQIVLK